MSFTTNRWVRGDDFFGRADLLERLKKRRGRATWILGNRRVGKTSLLRHIEWLCDTGTWRDTEAVYWDFQGSGSAEGLKESFLECLEDKPSLLEKLDAETDPWDDLSFQEITLRFRRRLKRLRPQRVLILVDEVEELVDICRDEPQVLGALRKLQDATGFVTLFIAGSLRLLELDESRARTSPFLPDFLPPLLLGPLDPEAAAALLGCGGIDGIQATEIHDLCFGNPHLIQCFAERFLRFGNHDDVMSDLKRQKVLDYYFQSVFHCLPRKMTPWWEQGRCLEELRQVPTDHPNFQYLEQASLLRKEADGSVEVNPLLVFLETQRPVTLQLDGDDDGQRVNPTQPLFGELAQLLAAGAHTLSVLPRAALQHDFSGLAEASNPPGLDILYSSGEPTSKLLSILDGASPEYILGTPGTARTTVYLVGLYLYHWLFGHAPFFEVEDPWARAEHITEGDLPMAHTSQWEQDVDPRLAIVLLRALNPHAEDRYADLETLIDDLKAVFDTP